MAARLLCRTAARSPYGEGAEDLLDLAGLAMEPSFIQRLAQRVGIQGQPLLERFGQRVVVPTCRDRRKGFRRTAARAGLPRRSERRRINATFDVEVGFFNISGGMAGVT